MARGNKLGNQSHPSEEPAEKLIRQIIDDVVNTATLPLEEQIAADSGFTIPPAIPVSRECEYPVTKSGLDAANKLTDQTWTKREDYRQIINRKEFKKLSFNAIGEAISNRLSNITDDDDNFNSTELDDDFYRLLAGDYDSILDKNVNKISRDVDWHIPCHIFHVDQNVNSFLIGPVNLLTRKDWINRFVLDTSELKIINEIEDGKLSLNDLRSNAHSEKGNGVNHRALRILDTLQNYAWIATLKINSHELSQSHYKAITIVGLALDALGLRFHVTDARRFTKAGRQHLYLENRLATSDNGEFIYGFSMLIPGIGSGSGMLTKKMLDEQTFMTAAGDILNEYISKRQKGRAPHLIERWANALYWVGEARREASDFMAIVNYGCAADGLSGAGGEAKNMIEFAIAALNPTKKQETTNSISRAVNKVYREGRNKLAHGEASGLLEDLNETRALGDVLLVRLFDIMTIAIADIIKNKKEILTLDEKHAYRALKGRLEQQLYECDTQND